MRARFLPYCSHEESFVRAGWSGSVVLEVPQAETHDEHDAELVSRVQQEPRKRLRVVPHLKVSKLS